MTNIEALEKLIKEDALLEVEDNIKELEESLEKKSKKTVQEELEYMKGVRKYFYDLLEVIDKKELTEDKAMEVLIALESIKVDEEEI